MDAPVSRREALGLLGAAALAAVAAACSGGGSSDSSSSRTRSTSSTPGTPSSASTASCVLTPEMTEGPFYLDDQAVRGDITDGKAGVPLRLDLGVVDADTCRPIPDASVEVWHADATGNYSGFGSTRSATFLRGVQLADSNGRVSFETVYPGWYQGRAVHIHLKVHKGGNEVHTTQLFFDEKVSDAVYETAPYSSRSGRRTTNAQDDIYAGGGAQSTLALAESGAGYVGTLDLGIRNRV